MDQILVHYHQLRTTARIVHRVSIDTNTAADAAGEVTEVLAVAGQQVAADDLLIDIDTAEQD